MLNYNELEFSSIEVSDVDTKDYPNFSDAFISYAEYKGGIELDEDELDELNEDSDLVYEAVMKHLGY